MKRLNNTTIPITVSRLSLNERRSKKEIIWMNSVTYVATKTEERSMIQFCLHVRTLDPHIKAGTIRNPHQNSQLINDPLCF